MLIPGPRLAHFMTNRNAVEHAAGKSLLRAKAGRINFTRGLAFRAYVKMLTGIFLSPTTGTAMTAKRLTLMFAQRKPILIRIYV
jgi:hypothetical protein